MRRHDYDKLRAELLDAHARITELLRLLPDIYPELIDALPGYPTSTGGGGASSLGVGGTPGGLDRFVTQSHPASDDMRTLRQSAIATANSSRSALAVARRWLNVPASITDEHQPRSGGDCVACGIYCSGAERDRLRSGLCDACRQSWRRYQDRAAQQMGSGDRAGWMLERRRDILAAEA